MSDLRMRIVDFQYIRAGDILPNPDNWRVHSKAQKDAYNAMVESVGYAGAQMVFETDDGDLMFVDGHMRADEHPDELLPTLITDLNADEAREILATFDPISAMAEANKDKLKALHEKLSVLRNDTTAARDAVLKSIRDNNNVMLDEDKPDDDPGAEVDRASELNEKWQVKRGDVWQVGKHRIMCGDSTCAEDVDKLLNNSKPELMITDPPYGVEYDASWRDDAAHAGLLSVAQRRTGAVPHDNRVDWQAAIDLFPGDIIYCWHADLHASAVANYLETAGFVIRCQIIWNKPHFVIGRGHYHTRHEPCWYAFRKGRAAGWVGDNTQDTIWNITLDKNVAGGHSTQKPVECMARPIRNHKGDVYDPFLGSGTTLVACEQTGRVGYGMEIAPEYVAVCLERLSGMGLEAVRHLMDDENS